MNDWKTYPFRSGLEERIAQDLVAKNEEVIYEPSKSWVCYQKKQGKYKPDFLLKNGIIIEAKGRFEAQDRSKHLQIKEQHPLLDIRFVFDRSTQKLGGKSKTTYQAWCEKHGFLYADKRIPQTWIDEELSQEVQEYTFHLLGYFPNNKRGHLEKK